MMKFVLSTILIVVGWLVAISILEIVTSYSEDHTKIGTSEKEEQVLDEDLFRKLYVAP